MKALSFAVYLGEECEEGLRARQYCNAMYSAIEGLSISFQAHRSRSWRESTGVWHGVIELVSAKG